MMCPDELVTYLTALSIVISNDKTSEETAYLSVLFSQISVSLGTIAAQKKLIEEKCNPKETDNTIPTEPFPETDESFNFTVE